MNTKIQIISSLVCFLATGSVHAERIDYTFSGNYYVAGGSQGYTGSFSIDNPAITLDRPVSAPDVTSPTYQSIWSGTSRFYTGGSDLSITFASGTVINAASFGIVVNNTTYSGAGAPYSLGLSAQLYPGSVTITPPTTDVCATPTGACGEDDDPLYHDSTQAAIMNTSGVYFAFYNGPDYTSSEMPNLADYFGPQQGGLGIYQPNIYGFTTTTLTQFTEFSSTVVPSVPVPGAVWLFGSAMAGLIGFSRRKSV